MNSNLAFLVVVCTTAVVGCTPMQWSRDDATEAQADADAAECRSLAWREARMQAWLNPPWYYGSRYRSSLWPPGPMYGGPPFSDPFFRESRLAGYCMESKGYRLKPAQAR